jgi:hypothetical protein
MVLEDDNCWLSFGAGRDKHKPRKRKWRDYEANG